MRIVKNFEYGNLQRTNERFRWSKWHKRYSFPSGTPVSVMRKMEILPPRPVGSATIARHWRQAAVHVARVAERSACMHAYSGRHACMLILIRKRNIRMKSFFHVTTNIYSCSAFSNLSFFGVLPLISLHIRMKYGLLWWTPSLNDRSKLKGQYSDVKSWCGISVGSILNPHSLSLNTFLMTLSL